MQMMTDVILPLGLSFYKALIGDHADMVFAGGRLYMDVSSDLKTWWGRKMLLYSFGETDALIRNALEGFLKDGEVLSRLGKSGSWSKAFKWDFCRWVWKAIKLYRRGDVSGVSRVVEGYGAVVGARRAKYEKLSGEALFDAIMSEMADFYMEYMKSGEDAAYLMLWLYSHGWLQKNMKKWLGEERAVDVLSKSVPGNPTSEMGLALLDIARLASGRPAVAEYLERAKDEGFVEGLRQVDVEAAKAFSSFLEKYGMRCPGEIDIAKPRWSQRPTTLIPMIKACAASDAADGATLFERGRAEAEAKAEELVRKRVICEREDIFYLTLEELREASRTGQANIRQGDILVTPFTDPSWTPFFVSVKGLVTEVGGQMTHGAVITREYGLPAVVGVEDATKKIPDGSRIRVNGTEGWVEILK
jgi:pyruvate,water dikinase